MITKGGALRDRHRQHAAAGDFDADYLTPQSPSEQVA
jgi:hypothetical protein